MKLKNNKFIIIKDYFIKLIRLVTNFHSSVEYIALKRVSTSEHFIKKQASHQNLYNENSPVKAKEPKYPLGSFEKLRDIPARDEVVFHLPEKPYGSVQMDFSVLAGLRQIETQPYEESNSIKPIYPSGSFEKLKAIPKLSLAHNIIQ